jgi:hypothetical protein
MDRQNEARRKRKTGKKLGRTEEKREEVHGERREKEHRLLSSGPSPVGFGTERTGGGNKIC